MQILLRDNWKVAGAHPFTPLQGASMETGQALAGVTPMMDAKVPGSVYDDLLRAGLIEDPYYECNSLRCEWVANRFWSYQTTFSVPSEAAGKKVRLVLKGIDYHAHISCNGNVVAEHVGMYVPCVVDVTETVRPGEENSLLVVLEDAPHEMGQIGYTSRTWTQKARFGYKWDFGTRLVNLGLYDIVYLDICDDPLTDVHIRYLGDGLLTVTAKNPQMQAVLSYQGKTVCTAVSVPTENGSKIAMTVDNPLLWYPNGYGKQPLYDLTLTTTDDEKTYPVGLRTLTYRQPDCADTTCLPYIPVVNGREIYIKGVNMTPLDHMYGCVTGERYDRLLTLARDGHVNLIRVWGGGIIEKEEFYELCDRYGIMVWQEFIQSSSGIDNIPSKDPTFLTLCEKTARAVIPEKRNHTCLTFWSGGNELMDEHGIPSTYEDANIAMLKAICDELSPEILMLPTSASGPTEWFIPDCPEKNQDVHGPWKYEGVTGQYALYNRSTIILHSEFGVDGMNNLSALETVLSPANRKVTTMGENLVWRHHGEWWDTYAYREYPLFGVISDLETLVNLSQYMQAEGIRYAIEAHRRRSATAQPMPLTAGKLYTHPAQKNVGSIVWQLNEPWCCVSSTSLTDYYANPKLAFLFFKDAHKPRHISLRYDKFLWTAGETFIGTLFAHDDAGDGFDAAVVTVLADGKKVDATLSGNQVTFVIPDCASFTVTCLLYKEENVVDENVYLYLVGEMGAAPVKPVLEFVSAYWRRGQN